RDWSSDVCSSDLGPPDSAIVADIKATAVVAVEERQGVQVHVETCSSCSVGDAQPGGGAIEGPEQCPGIEGYSLGVPGGTASKNHIWKARVDTNNQVVEA